MTLQTHTFGAVNLLDTSKYQVLRQTETDPNWDLEYVPIRATDGALRSYARLKETTRTLQIEVRGSDYAAADANADAINDICVLANTTRNQVTYVIKDTSESSGDTWKVIGAKWRPQDDLRSFNLIKGTLIMGLSKN